MSLDADPEAAPEPEARGPAGSRLRARLLTLLKLLVAFGLLAWIIQSGKFRPDKLARVVEAPAAVALALALAAVSISLSGLRWSILLRGEGIRVPLVTALRLTWIGHFWNMVIPGAVSGDAVKMFYIGRVVPERREEAWTTVLADRVIGLIALVSLSAFASLAGLEFVWSRPDLRRLFLLTLAILGGCAIFGLALILGIGRGWSVVARVRDRLPLSQTLTRGYQALYRVGRRPGGLLATYSISLVAHCLTVGNTYLLGRAAGETALALSKYLVVVPIAMFSNAIPVSPGGLGIGENVLGSLFDLAGGSASDGVNVMLLMRGVFYALALVGAVLYALHRRSAPQDEPATPPAVQRQPAYEASEGGGPGPDGSA